MNTTQLIEVVRAQAVNIVERYPDYRAQIVRRLVEIIGKQREGLTEKGRRTQVASVIDAFGGEVAAKTKD